MSRIHPLSYAEQIHQTNAATIDAWIERINMAIERSRQMPIRVDLHHGKMAWQDFSRAKDLAHANLARALTEANYAWEIAEAQYDQKGDHYSRNVSPVDGHTYTLSVVLSAPQAK